MATFKAFKPEAMQRIARSMGHMGDMNQFENFLMANPDKSAMMRNYNARAMQMAEGGVVKKMQEEEGGMFGTTPISPMPIKPLPGPDDPPATDTPVTDTPTTDKNTQPITDFTIDQIKDPKLPEGGKLDPNKIGEKDDQFIADDKGKVKTDKPKVEVTKGDTTTADPAKKVEAETYDPTKVGDAPKAEAKTTQVTDDMLVKAAQGDMSPEELATYDAALKAGQAEVQKKATVQGQLEMLSAQAEDGQIPSYATAAVRSAMNAMAARGLGASSMASGAVFNNKQNCLTQKHNKILCYQTKPLIMHPNNLMLHQRCRQISLWLILQTTYHNLIPHKQMLWRSLIQVRQMQWLNLINK
jgi:hypothetical protein